MSGSNLLTEHVDLSRQQKSIGLRPGVNLLTLGAGELNRTGRVALKFLFLRSSATIGRFRVTTEADDSPIHSASPFGRPVTHYSVPEVSGGDVSKLCLPFFGDSPGALQSGACGN